MAWHLLHTAGCSHSSHTPEVLGLSSPPAYPPTPYCGCCGICPLLTDAVLTPRAATLQVHATYTAMHGGCLATQGLVCPFLPPCWGPDLDWEVKGGD